MMHDGGWFSMGGMGLYWQIPVLVAALVAVGWFFAKRRSGDGR